MHNSSLYCFLNVSVCMWVNAADTYGGVGLRDFAACRRRSGERDLDPDLERERLLDLDLEWLLLLKVENAKTHTIHYVIMCCNLHRDVFYNLSINFLSCLDITSVTVMGGKNTLLLV